MDTPKNDKANTKTGLALSGGILVAAAGGAATMRGFQQKSVLVDGEKRPALEAFDYISGISGGCIPTLLYCYARDTDSGKLLDADFRVTDPSQITLEVLNRKNKKSIFRSLTSSVFVRAIPTIIYGLLTFGLDKIWTLSVWLATLHPFGIKRNKFFLLDEPSKAKDSITLRTGIKAIPLTTFLMVGEAQDLGSATNESYKKVKDRLDDFVNTFVPPEEITRAMREVNNQTIVPFVASPTEVTNSYIPNIDKENFQIRSVPAQEWGGRDKPFSLEFLLGMATNFPGLTKAPMAQRRTVSLQDGGKMKELLFADGGKVDGLGVAALVQRKVGTIVASIWPHGDSAKDKDDVKYAERKYAKFYARTKGYSLEEWLKEVAPLGLADVASYFGYYSENAKNEFSCGHFMNRMFKDGEYHLGKLREDLDALFVAGKPLVATMKSLETVDNPFWGIQGGETIDLTIVYASLPRSFAEKIPRESGLFTNEEFKDFPNLHGVENVKTKINTWNLLKTGSLSNRQANMTAYLGSWIVEEAWEGLTVNGKTIFGGFKDILENK